MPARINLPGWLLDSKTSPPLQSQDCMRKQMLHNMPTCVVEVITGAKEKGKSKYGKYVEERLNTRSKPITDTLQRCNLPYQWLVHLRNDSQVRQVISSDSGHWGTQRMPPRYCFGLLFSDFMDRLLFKTHQKFKMAESARRVFGTM